MDKRSYTNTYKDVDMPISTVGYYLAKWKFTSKKPIKRAYERKDSATKAGKSMKLKLANWPTAEVG